ncbi:MAG: MBL fold metallo-hydrolase [bacterium]|nr:MBL fold metallo-hydrolase [bacterium]
MDSFRKNLPWYILGLLFVATLLVWYAVGAEDRGGKLTVAFLNIGQGDAIFIESPTGVQMMIDGGPGAVVLRELGKVMPFYDRSIDLLLVSNPDTDHLSGFLDVLRSFKVVAVVEPGTVGASADFHSLENAIEKEGARKVLAQRGQKLDLGGGVYFEILFPDRDVSGLNTNDGSIVGKLVYGNTSFLFLGDAPASIEEYVAYLDKEHLNVDVLKVGHHGSKTSTSEALLGFASPAMAVISAGKDNKYGHPHAEVLDRLKQFEVQTFGTYEKGRVIMESDGETVWVKK